MQRALRWPAFDEMTALLLFAQLEFLAILIVLVASVCAPWPLYVNVVIIVAPAIAALVIWCVRRLSRRRE